VEAAAKTVWWRSHGGVDIPFSMD